MRCVCVYINIYIVTIAVFEYGTMMLVIIQAGTLTTRLNTIFSCVALMDRLQEGGLRLTRKPPGRNDGMTLCLWNPLALEPFLWAVIGRVIPRPCSGVSHLTDEPEGRFQQQQGEEPGVPHIPRLLDRQAT